MTLTPEIIERVTRNTNVNERVSFNRRITNLEAFINSHVAPIEQQIMTLREQLIPLYDKVAELREEAVDFCTHPAEYLEEMPTDSGSPVIHCKFCNAIFHIDV